MDDPDFFFNSNTYFDRYFLVIEHLQNGALKYTEVTWRGSEFRVVDGNRCLEIKGNFKFLIYKGKNLKDTYFQIRDYDLLRALDLRDPFQMIRISSLWAKYRNHRGRMISERLSPMKFDTTCGLKLLFEKCLFDPRFFKHFKFWDVTLPAIITRDHWYILQRRHKELYPQVEEVLAVGSYSGQCGSKINNKSSTTEPITSHEPGTHYDTGLEAWDEYRRWAEGIHRVKAADVSEEAEQPSTLKEPYIHREGVSCPCVRIKCKLHKAFREEHIRLRREMRLLVYDMPNTSHEKIISSGAGDQWRYIAWNTGIAAIKRLLRGILPRTLKEVVRLLQVAYAMALQNTRAHNLEASFRSDLSRWITVVPKSDVEEFKIIAEEYWCYSPFSIRTDIERPDNETLLDIQQLLSVLVSDNPLEEIFSEVDEESQQTETDRERIKEVRSAILNISNAYGDTEDPTAYAHTRKLPNIGKPAEPVIILMMAGAIFGFVLSFALLMRSVSSPYLESQMDASEGLRSANPEERSLHTLLLYMGLSMASLWEDISGFTFPSLWADIDSLTIPSPQDLMETDTTTDSPFSQSQASSSSSDFRDAKPSPSHEPTSLKNKRDLRCSQCDKKFSNVGNLNRHTRSDCVKSQRFFCRNPGCRKSSNRKDNRDKHEKYRCAQKLAAKMEWESSLMTGMTGYDNME